MFLARHGMVKPHLRWHKVWKTLFLWHLAETVQKVLIKLLKM
jgi:hypothetical protein